MYYCADFRGSWCSGVPKAHREAPDTANLTATSSSGQSSSLLSCRYVVQFHGGGPYSGYKGHHGRLLTCLSWFESTLSRQYAGLAPMVEQSPCKRMGSGSNPLTSTIYPCVAPLVTRRRWPIVTGQISGRKNPPKGREAGSKY